MLEVTSRLLWFWLTALLIGWRHFLNQSEKQKQSVFPGPRRRRTITGPGNNCLITGGYSPSEEQASFPALAAGYMYSNWFVTRTFVMIGQDNYFDFV